MIPARDEQRGIEAAVRSHLAQDYPNLEVIVVDDRSTDGTAAILAGLAAGDRRLTVVAGVEPPAGWLGKPHAVFQGAERSSGELLLFADADVRYEPDAVSAAVALMSSRGLDLLAFFPRLEMRGFWENVLMPYIALSYFFGPAFLINSDLQGRFAAGGGAGMLVRAAAYRSAGGHEALRGSVIDDIHLAIRVRRAGRRCRMVLADHLVGLRMYRGFREVFDGFTKNIAYAFEGWLGVFLAISTAFTFVASTVPLLVLVAGGLGVPFSHEDIAWAGLAVAVTVLARAGLALLLRYPLWAALTQPLTAVVWAAMMARSFAWRFLRRQVVWRGRRYHASRAGF